MKYRIDVLESFSFYGLTRTFSIINGANFRDIPKFWDEIMENGSFKAMISNASDSRSLGVCMPMDMEIESNFDYVIGAFSDIPVNGYDFHIVETAEWAIFELVGPISETIQSTWKYIYSQWYEETGYKHAKLPEFEVYSDGDVTSIDYYMEIWIPIER